MPDHLLPSGNSKVDSVSRIGLLKYKQVAEMFAVSERTVRNWVRSGILPVVRIRGAVRFDPEDLRRAINIARGR